jgi:hypothetical protein
MRNLTSLFSGVAVAWAFGVMPVPQALASASVVYDSLPTSLPPSMASLGFQATQASEFGDYVQLAGTNRVPDTVTVTMVNWALQSTPANEAYCSANPSKCNPDSFIHPITLNVYSAIPATPLNTVGPLLGSVTQMVSVPWRPEADPTCPSGTAWRASDGNCYNGFAFNATFDLSSLNVTLPDDIIVGVAYNTQTYGTSPLVADGPYNSLNVGVVGSATVGNDQNTDNVFWNTSTAGWYTDGGVGGVGVFREDTNWTPYGTVPMRITASPEPVGPPTDKSQCMKNGWKVFNNPAFKSQGDCISWLQSSNKAKGNRKDNLLLLP